MLWSYCDKNNTFIECIYQPMAPTTPQKKPIRRKYDTIKRSRFFDAFDSKEDDQSLREIARLPEINIPPSTARTWLAKREHIGSLAVRRTRKNSSTLGRKPLVSTADLTQIINQQDPIHKKGYEEQVKELGSTAAPRTLQEHTSKAGARRFKKPYQTKISKKN
jgi:hypothetical protein